ncbi:hypothetical protein EYF80_042087 [Liparis tanakae]|uniref:Uncharacterized protein n=1 Tax=Liparis tanakae TaxID=230148 RepID=A0A4Z2G3I3_9TELE|nr:hypothetical protein EYF80_042087 [Liparis tanakae]
MSFASLIFCERERERERERKSRPGNRMCASEKDELKGLRQCRCPTIISGSEKVRTAPAFHGATDAKLVEK